MEKVVIVLPTYNEKENIGNIIEAINLQRALLPNSDLNILVVDDSSPDGTADKVREYSSTLSNVHLLGDNPKEGIGAAYLRGFGYALNILNADIVCQMDSDFSHDPKVLPSLINEVQSGSADVSIGSRYTTGGSIPENWSKLRILNSKTGNFLARNLVGLNKINDCTSGFRAIRANIIKKVLTTRMDTKGYVFLVSILEIAKKQKARFSEVPIHYTERVYGKSKIRFKDIQEFVFHSFKARLNNITIKFHYPLFLLFCILFLALSKMFLGPDFIRILIYSFLAFFSVFLTIQGAFTLYWMIYTWEDPQRIEKSKSPKVFDPPATSFSAIIPARHESQVIKETIHSLSKINYPQALSEFLIVIRTDDIDTLIKAQEAINEVNQSNIKILTFSDTPINKPHSLNLGLQNSTKDYVVVFDAEDEPHTDIFNIVNTLILKDKSDVIQSGVQIMNFKSTWFSTLNVLEYFFWFKSTLHYFLSQGLIPLGGNTVFFKKSWLHKIEGWDETSLTEDADIGIRLSSAGAKIQLVYDELHVTKEESPPSLSSFMKQRTRWIQGFLQVFLKGDWLNLPKFSQRVLVAYILIWPIFQSLMLLFIPISLLMIFFYKLPIFLSILTTIPLYLLILQMITYNIGLIEFVKDYKLKSPLWMPLKILITYYPFQLILCFSALRAALRLLDGELNWEKTRHINAHREGADKADVYIAEIT